MISLSALGFGGGLWANEQYAAANGLFAVGSFFGLIAVAWIMYVFYSWWQSRSQPMLGSGLAEDEREAAESLSANAIAALKGSGDHWAYGVAKDVILPEIAAEMIAASLMDFEDRVELATLCLGRTSPDGSARTGILPSAGARYYCSMPEDNEPDYEYRGLIAQAWDLLRGYTSGWPDRSFYLSLIHEVGEPVLDVGCGTGRLLLDYASQGIDIDGVDNSPEMLALCREKAAARELRPALFEQRMEMLDLPRRFRTIIVPSSSFQLVIDPGDARDALRRFHHHLEPGGGLAMSFMLMWSGPPQTTEQAKEWRRRKDREREDGSIVRRWERARYDADAQLEHTEDRYEIIVSGEVVETEEHSRSPSARWYRQEQSRELYEEAGFVDVLLYSGFSNDPASGDDRMWTVVGRRRREERR